MASSTQDLAFDALGAAGYTGNLTERLINWRAATNIVSWSDYALYIMAAVAINNLTDAEYAFWLAGLGGGGAPTTGFLLEDGVSFILLEDGSSYLLQES